MIVPITPIKVEIDTLGGKTFRTECTQIRVRSNGTAVLLDSDGSALVGAFDSLSVVPDPVNWVDLMAKVAGLSVAEGDDGYYMFAEGMNEPVLIVLKD